VLLFPKAAGIITKLIQATISNGQQAQLIQVRVIETPATTQISQQAVADDVSQCALCLLPGQPHELGGAQVFN
jgi:hypothetical protein